MSRNICFILFVLCVLFSTFSGIVHGNSIKKSRPLEELYLEIGYQSVESALIDFELKLNKKLKMPIKLPPLPFTHHFGRFSDLEGDANDEFEVEYLNEKSPHYTYRINIRPKKNGIPIKEKYVVNSYKLKDGSKAVYMNILGSNALIFEKDNWQYRLSVDKKVSDIVTPEVLVEVANSI